MLIDFTNGIIYTISPAKCSEHHHVAYANDGALMPIADKLGWFHRARPQARCRGSDTAAYHLTSLTKTKPISGQRFDHFTMRAPIY